METISRIMGETAFNFLESFICTGSDLNQRSFNASESWNSLESSVLAGYLSVNADGTHARCNSTSFLLDDFEETRQLNHNLDAIYEDENDVFLDLPYYFGESSFNSPRHEEMSFLNTPPESDSGIIKDENTGVILRNMLDEFDRNSTHSTPSTDSSKSHEIRGLTDQNYGTVRRTIFLLEHDHAEPSSFKLPSPSLLHPPSVSQMKKLFEPRVRRDSVSSINRSRMIKKKQARSPTFHTHQHLKIARATKNFPSRSPRKLRPSSCSEYPSSFSDSSPKSSTRRKSVGDTSSEASMHSIVKSVHAAYARYMELRSTHLTPHQVYNNRASPGVKRKSYGARQTSSRRLKGSKVSAIMSRKSLGPVSSPVKPVEEIRKIFSPTAKFDHAPKRKSTVDKSRKEVPGSATSAKRKNVSRIPRLIVEHH